MVSIVAFQAMDPGSIPGRRSFLFFWAAGGALIAKQKKLYSDRGSNSGPRACEARVITSYTIRALRVSLYTHPLYLKNPITGSKNITKKVLPGLEPGS